MNWQNKIYNELLEEKADKPETAEFEVSKTIAALRKSGHVGGTAKPTPESEALKAKAMNLITKGRLMKPKGGTGAGGGKA